MAPTNIKTFELKIGKTGVVIIVVGMAVLLSISFLFGVDVGKISILTLNKFQPYRRR